MNAQHTPGRLTVRGGYGIYSNDGKTPVAGTCLPNSMPESDEANARRLVACWNACDGISTEALENMPQPFGSLLSTGFQDVVAQRDELLEALKLADLLLSGANMNRAVVESKVRAAIAKVEGGAA